MFELEKAGLKVKDGQQVMLEAREIKSADEIALLNRAAAMVDGAYHLINEKLQARRARERHRRRGEQVPLHPRLRRRRSGQRHFRRALQSASAQFHRPHDPAGRPGVLRHPAVLHGLSHLLLPHLQRRPRHDRRSATPTRRRANGSTTRSMRIKPGASTAHIAKRSRRRASSASPTRCRAFGLQFAHGLGLALHERPIISRVVSMDHPTEIKEGMVFAIETYCPATDGYSGRAHRGRGRGHRQGLQGDLAVPGGGTADLGEILRLHAGDRAPLAGDAGLTR